jgi:hypothetical protein
MINIQERDDNIIIELEESATLKETAIKYKLSISRVNTIYNKYKNLMAGFRDIPGYAELYKLLGGDTRSLNGLKRIGVTDVDTLIIMYKYDTELNLLLHGARSLGVKSVAYIKDCLGDVQVNTIINKLPLLTHNVMDILDMNKFYREMYNKLSDNGFINLYADISATINGHVINPEYTIVGKVVDFDFSKETIDVILLIPEVYEPKLSRGSVRVKTIPSKYIPDAFGRMLVKFVVDMSDLDITC